MRLLVLGGTRFLGRTLVQDALDRGWDVTTLNRGLTGAAPPGVHPLVADRTSTPDVERALDGATWDVVVDTWSGAPRVATDAAALLAGRAGAYGYVSSISVYAWGTHVDETSPLVDGDPRADDGEYPAVKRGAELGVLAAHPGALLARAGLLLGPYEDVGRLPWWLTRVAQGGRVVAPGRPDRPLQYVDARDVARWMLTALEGGTGGAFDVTSRSGHATTASLLEACVAATGSDAELVWVDEAMLDAAGAQPWTQLPCWVPETGDFAGFLEGDTSRATRAGLVCRPVEETVADTWRWMTTDGAPPQRPGGVRHGLPAELEATLLAGR